MATTLVYTKSAFTPFTKIVSADVNQFFTDIKSRVNWAGGTDAATGLGDANLQSNAATGGGLTRNTKLKAGTANYVVVNDSNGKMTEEQYLATSRGGAGGSLATANSGDVPVYNGTIYTPLPPIPTGVTFPYAGLTSPTGYLICDGSPVSRTTYSVLYGVLGSTFGSGDGSTTFNLPDLRGSFVRGSSNWITDSVTCSNSSGNLLFTGTSGKVTRTGQRVQFTASGLPGNISGSTDYYTIYVTPTTYKVTTSYSDAVGSQSSIVAFSSSGSVVVTNNFLDPDVTTRTKLTTGSTSTSQNPGTWQSSANYDHTHALSTYTSWTHAGSQKPGMVGDGSAAANYDTGTENNNASSWEARPTNISMNYIIKT